jgi:hypothetical protein
MHQQLKLLAAFLLELPHVTDKNVLLADLM